MIFFLSYRKNILGIQKQVRVTHGKRVIRVRAIEVLLYIQYRLKSYTHYENMPIQLYRKFHLQELKKFR